MTDADLVALQASSTNVSKVAVITPAELARELDVSQKRIRDYLRETYGVLRDDTPRWQLTEEQAAGVRERFATADDDARPFEGATVPELLGQYAEILAELRTRGIIRTSNAPLGDYAEYLAQQVMGARSPPIRRARTT